MKIVTINLPKIYIDMLQYLIKNNVIQNRSQGIREAIKDFLEKEDELIIDLSKYVDITINKK